MSIRPQNKFSPFIWGHDEFSFFNAHDNLSRLLWERVSTADVRRESTTWLRSNQRLPSRGETLKEKRKGKLKQHWLYFPGVYPEIWAAVCWCLVSWRRVGYPHVYSSSNRKDTRIIQRTTGNDAWRKVTKWCRKSKGIQFSVGVKKSNQGSPSRRVNFLFEQHQICNNVGSSTLSPEARYSLQEWGNT